MFRVENNVGCLSSRVDIIETIISNILNKVNQISEIQTHEEYAKNVRLTEEIKTDIAKLEESLRQTTKKIPEIDMKKFSEIDQCKSDIAKL
jgi:prophage DNA circulation protein